MNAAPAAGGTSVPVTANTLGTTTTTAQQTGTNAPPGSRAAWPSSIFAAGGAQYWPVVPGSGGFAQDIVADYQHAYGTVGVNVMPIYEVPATQPLVPLSARSGCQDYLPSTGSEAPVPPYVSLLGSSDNPLVVYQPSTGRDWELWQVAPAPGGGYSACWGGMLDTHSSDGVFSPDYGMSATGISYLATAITEQDIASGSIDHAIALQVPHCNTWVAPAIRGDCHLDPGQPAEGQWFRFPPGTPEPKDLTPFGQMVFQALKSYGAVVTDYSAGVNIVIEQPSDWFAEGHPAPAPLNASMEGDPLWAVIASLPWSSLQAVTPPPSP